MVSLVHRWKLLPGHLVVLNLAGTFFIPYCFYQIMTSYSRLIFWSAGAIMLVLTCSFFWLRFLSKCGNDHSNNHGSNRWIELNRDTKIAF